MLILAANIPLLAYGQTSLMNKEPPTNVILIMSDDQGWGDVAYNGNTVLLTPELDKMAKKGIRLDRFYAASPVCSPTRASVLTGRHPFRYGIEWAGVHHLPDNEITLAEVLQTHGYQTGHFGKWHVGELSKTINQSYFKGDNADPSHYSPPWANGFSHSFSTESMMPTYNPYYHVGGDFGSKDYRHLQTEPVTLGQKHDGFRWRDHYWLGEGKLVDEWLEGDDSKIIMDKALSFIEQKSETQQAFLAVIWFHTPHTPLVASDAARQRYSKYPMPAQHFYGAITAMDQQIGRLRERLKQLEIADNTLVWFKSDNGPSYIHDYNSSGPFSGKKGELKEGGIRVPAIIEWPEKFAAARQIATPLSTSDIYPTILSALGLSLPEKQARLDGEDIMPILLGERRERLQPIAFQSPVRGAKYDADESQLQFALSGNQYKLYSGDNGKSWQLYDIKNDWAESTDLSKTHPEITLKMRAKMQRWVEETKLDAMDSN